MIDNNLIEWDSDSVIPSDSGWYAVHYCWDGNEGSFVGAARFDGNSWKESLPVIAFAGKFINESGALEWASNNDISF